MVTEASLRILTADDAHCGRGSVEGMAVRRVVGGVAMRRGSHISVALVYGKTAPASLLTVRMHSLSVEWSDSDSSVDSMPDSASEDDSHDEDWPEHAGFQVSVWPDSRLECVVQFQVRVCGPIPG